MWTISAPAHRSARRSLAEQLAPTALRTRPYTRPLADDQPSTEAADNEPLDDRLTPRRA